VHEKEIGGLCPKKKDAMMVTQYVHNNYQMGPTLIPEKSCFNIKAARLFCRGSLQTRAVVI